MTGKHQPVALALVLAGAAAAVYGIIVSPQRTWPDLLLNGFNLASLAIAAVFFIASQRLGGARWSASLRRIPEAFMPVLPWAAALMLILYFGRHWIYTWSRPGAFHDAPAIAGKVEYLQTPYVFARMAAVFLVWGVFAWMFRRASLEQDRNPAASLACHQRMNRYAAAFIVVFAVSFTIGAWDWLISVQADWFSTIFAIYVFAGAFVQGIAAITLATVVLKSRGLLGDAVGEFQLQDLGRMLFAFTMFWAYIWTCQYLLIWYGNLPEETPFYLVRTTGPWLFVFLANFAINWVVPFGALLSLRAKCNPRVLVFVSVSLLFGHWLDLYQLILPALFPTPPIGVVSIPVAAGYAALAYLVFVRSLAKAPLVPVNDPVLVADSYARALHEQWLRRWAPGAQP